MIVITIMIALKNAFTYFICFTYLLYLLILLSTDLVVWNGCYTQLETKSATYHNLHDDCVYADNVLEDRPKRNIGCIAYKVQLKYKQHTHMLIWM